MMCLKGSPLFLLFPLLESNGFDNSEHRKLDRGMYAVSSSLRLRVAPAREMMDLAFPPRGNLRSPFPSSPISLAPPSTTSLAYTSFSAASSSSSSSSGLALGDEGTREKPWLFVGLGNPGKMYESTRHNVILLHLLRSG